MPFSSDLAFTSPPEDEWTAADYTDLDAVREFLGSGEWINLPWLSANPKSVVAAYLDSTSVGFV